MDGDDRVVPMSIELTDEEKEAQKRRELFMNPEERLQDIDEKYDERFPWWTR